MVLRSCVIVMVLLSLVKGETGETEICDQNANELTDRNDDLALFEKNEIPGNEFFQESIRHIHDRYKFEVKKDTDGDNMKTERFEEFNSWLMKNGAKYPDLYMKRYTSDVRGVHAKNEISPYMCIVEIPFKCLITDHMGRTETEIGRKLFSSTTRLSSPSIIAVVIYILTTLEDPVHFFQPYYRILPREYKNFPVFWNEEQLSWLQGSPILHDIEIRKRNMRDDYEEICRVCPEFKMFSYNEFLKIRTAVGSRNFGVMIQGNKRTAMVPFADMLNHYRPRETSWEFKDTKDAFTITSLSPLLPHQQVMDSYGKKSNTNLFLFYGFALESNREQDGQCQNDVTIQFHLDKNGVRGKSALIAQQFQTKITMNFEDRSTMEALSYCRVAASTDEEIHKLISKMELDNSRPRGSPSIRNGVVSFISIANEIKALEMMAAYCEEQLLNYPDTYEENTALLQSVSPFTERRSALLIVLSEQEICRFWIQARDKVVALLKLPQGEIEKPILLRDFPNRDPADADLARYTVSLAHEIRLHQLSFVN